MLSIIIITWNDRINLEKCLRRLTALSHNPLFEIIVVDNASLDGTDEMVRHLFPQIILISNIKNEGIPKARNQGLEIAKGRHLLFLDSDAEMLPDSINILSSFLDAHREVGIVGPKMVCEDGSLQYSCRQLPTLKVFLLRLFGQEKHEAVKRYLMQDFDHQTERKVDWVIGASMMVKKEVFEKINSFDEDYFYAYEDVDLCLRAGKAGFEVWFIPSAVAIHQYQRKSVKGGVFNRFRWLHLISSLKFFWRNL